MSIIVNHCLSFSFKKFYHLNSYFLFVLVEFHMIFQHNFSYSGKKKEYEAFTMIDGRIVTVIYGFAAALFYFH